MEACGRAHQWAREIGRMGHEARLMAPQFVKPFVMGNQNDRADAAAITAAMQRSDRRYVGIKSAARQAAAGVAPDALVGGGPAHGARE